MPHVTRQVTPVECDTRLSIAFKILDDTETLSNHEPSLRIKSLTSAHSINNCPMKNIKCYAHLLEI